MEETRSEVLRRQNRRVFRWSLALAALLHVAVLAFGPWVRAEPISGSGTELVEGPSATDWSGTPFVVFFGPPAIVRDDDGLAREPPERVLRADRRLRLPLGCAGHDWRAVESAAGEVHLTVNESGRIDEVRLTETTGSRCWDQVMQAMANDLLYRWLPSDRFPAPVQVYQPVQLTLAGS